jgi:hypothetical protein
MRVLRVEAARGLAVCVHLAICVQVEDEQSGEEEVATDLVGPVARGDVLLVHAGVALASLGEAQQLASLGEARQSPPACANRGDDAPAGRGGR